MTSPYGKAAVRISLLHFMLGKAFNAVVSLLTLVALARWLSIGEYGVYIALVALQATLLALSSLGIDATAERFLPELRARHADHDLLGFVSGAMCARLASLLLLALLLLLAAQPLAALTGLGHAIEVLRSWVGVVVLTGLLSFAVVLLEAMLQQRQAQVCMSIYVGVKLLLLVVAHHYAQLDLAMLVKVESIATAAAALIALLMLMRHFPTGGAGNRWLPVLQNRRRMGRFATFNYLAQVAFQFFNAEFMKLLVTRLLGVLESARYGFAANLAETVQRYLPAVLLLRLIKPVFISRYTASGDFSQLNDMARIILKLNLLMLAPLIAFAVVFGGELLAALSGGKYGDAHWLLVSILLLLVPASHQLVLSLLASTLEQNAMQLYAGLASGVAFPLALALVPLLGPFGAVSASAASSLVYNLFATVYLRRRGYRYRPDLRGIAVFALAGIASCGTALALRGIAPGWQGILLALTGASLLYLGLVRALAAFSRQERALLNSILPKRLFIF